MKKNIEYQYLDALERILEEGEIITDERTGVGTIAVTNILIEHDDVQLSFPLLVSKKVPWKPVVGELLWFLEGSNDNRRLAEITFGDPEHSTIWSANADASYWKDKAKFPGDLGRVYGVQWRDWRSYKYTWDGMVPQSLDQLVDLIDRAKANPSDRRLIVSAWNPAELDKMALPPCHMMFQVNIINGYMDMTMVQRSCDMFLGVPFNIASYALLLHILAREVGVEPRKLSILLVNAHIYLNHVDQVKELLSRKETIRGKLFPLMSINKDAQLFNDDGSIGYKVDDFAIVGYDPLPTIKASMAV